MQLTSAVLVVTGAITAAAVVVAIAPRPALELIFGEPPDALTVLIGRHWGLLVALVGGLLIYAGYVSDLRLPVMVLAIAEKLAIGGLIFASRFRSRPLPALIAGADTIMAIVYIAIIATRDVRSG